MNQTKKHFDKISEDYDFYKKKNAFYYENLKKLLKKLIPENQKVLEVGCATGDLLLNLSPSYGVGFDISSEMIRLAKQKYRSKKIKFTTVWPDGNFDYIFMSDVIEHLENPSKTFRKIANLMGPKTIFINTMANPIWEPVLMLAEKLKLKMPEGPHKRINGSKIETILKKTGLKIIKHDYRLLVPINIAFISDFVNRYLEKYLKPLCFIEYFVIIKA